MPRKMHRAALRSALSAKAEAGQIVILDTLQFDAPKTKSMVAVQENVAAGESTLVLLAERNENVERSARNLQAVKTLRTSYLNIRDLLGYRKLIVPMDALEVLNAYLGEEKA
jgi:large subunit ribosomal protein L4